MDSKLIIGVLIIVVLAGAGWLVYQSGKPTMEQAGPLLEEHEDKNPDLVAVVSESIVGTWQSTEDPQFTREFRADGTAVDRYGNEDVALSTDTWMVFTAENPVAVSFPLEAGTAYVQIAMQGNQAELLNFKVIKLTPETLELVYLDRGGVLQFTRTGQ